MPNSSLTANDLVPQGAPRSATVPTFLLASGLLAASIATAAAGVGSPTFFLPPVSIAAGAAGIDTTLLLQLKPALPTITFTSDDPAWQNDNLRQYFDPSFFSATVNSSASVRVRFNVSNVSGISGTLDSMWIGQQSGADQWAFDGNQKQITFNGGATSLTLTQGMKAISDLIPINLNTNHGIVVSAHFSGTNVTLPSGAAASCTTWYYLGGDNSSQTDPGGFNAAGGGSIANAVEAISQIEFDVIEVAFNTSTLATGAANIFQPEFNQYDKLAFGNLSSGGAGLGAPAIVQKQVLTASSLTSGAALIGVPFTGFLGTSIATHAPMGLSAQFVQLNGFVASNIASGAAAIFQPAFNQKHVIVASSFSSSAVRLGSPSIQGYGLTAISISSVGASTGTPTINQKDGLISVSLAASVASIGTPAIHGTGVTAVSISSAVASLGVSTFVQKNVLSTAGIASQQDLVSIPAMLGEQWSVASGFTYTHTNKTAIANASSTNNVISVQNVLPVGKRIFSVLVAFSAVLDWPQIGLNLGGTSWYSQSLTYSPREGKLYFNGVVVATLASGLIVADTNPHTIDFAIDFTGQLLWIRIDGGNWNGNVGADPQSSAGGIDFSTHNPFVSSVYIVSYVPDASNSITLNTGDDAFVASTPASFQPWFATALLEQKQVLTAVAIASGAAQVGLASFGAVLTATSVASVADAFDTPIINQGLFTSGLSNNRPINLPPAFTQIGIGGSLATGPSGLGTPSLVQVNILVASSIASAADSIGQTFVGSVPSNLVTGAASLGQPIFAQTGEMIGLPVATVSANIGVASLNATRITATSLTNGKPFSPGVFLASGAYVFNATSIASSAASLGTAAIGAIVYNFTALQITSAAAVVGPVPWNQLVTLNVINDFASGDFDPTDFATYSGLVTGSNNLGHPAVVANVALGVPIGIAAASASITVPVLGQNDILQATSIASAAAALGSTSGVVTDVFLATDLASQAVGLGRPAMGQVNLMSAASIASQSVRFDLPSVGGGIFIFVSSVTSAFPVIGSPLLVTLYSLTQGNLATGVDVLGDALFRQNNVLSAVSLTSGRSSLDSPVFAGNVALTSVGLATGAVAFDRPTYEQSQVLGASNLQLSVAIGSATFTGVVSCFAGDLAVGNSSVPLAAFTQSQIIIPANLVTRIAGIDQASFGAVISILSASDIVVSADGIDESILSVSNFITDGIGVGAAELDQPVFVPLYVMFAEDLSTQASVPTRPSISSISALFGTVKQGKWIIYDRRRYEAGDQFMVPPSVKKALQQQGFLEK